MITIYKFRKVSSINKILLAGFLFGKILRIITNYKNNSIFTTRTY